MGQKLNWQRCSLIAQKIDEIMRFTTVGYEREKVADMELSSSLFNKDGTVTVGVLFVLPAVCAWCLELTLR